MVRKTVKDLETENNSIKAELEALKNMIMMGQGFASQPLQNDADDYIEFESISLVPLYLKTDTAISGRSDTYSFFSFGETQNIPINDAKAILRHNRSFIREGIVYIKNVNFVEKENLKQYYQNLLNAEQIKALINGTRKELDEKFNNLTKFQQDAVYGLLFERVSMGEDVDNELLYYIYQIMDKDIKKEIAELNKLRANKD